MNHEECRAAAQVDVEAIMQEIRSRVMDGGETKALPQYVPPQAKLFDGSASPVLYSEELNFLNANWNTWAEPTQFKSHRALGGGLIVRFKRRIQHFLFETIFKHYLERERAFQMNLVRFLNSTARYVDARDTALFWQIIEKMDADVKALNERTDRLFLDLAERTRGLENSPVLNREKN